MLKTRSCSIQGRIANLAKLLAEHGGRGLRSVCTAGGMGVAAIMESRKAAEMRMAA
jgi:acetyl-CoA C-acetyltransferase